jgi:hypothetical protein
VPPPSRAAPSLLSSSCAVRLQRRRRPGFCCSHSARSGNATAARRRRIEKGGACGCCGSAMRGGGRGRQPYPAPDGPDVAAIPPASRKMVQSLKGILADRSEVEIYATLCDCAMDPDVAVERLISQGIIRWSLPPTSSLLLAGPNCWRGCWCCESRQQRLLR